jgi:hypothetical protein
MDSIDMLSITLPAIPAEGRDFHVNSEDSHIVPISLSMVLPTLGELGELTSDPLVYCETCHQIIESPTALFVGGLADHSECLIRIKCRIPLKPGPCIAYKKRFFCESCVQEFKQVICAVCELIIDPFERDITLPNSRIIHTSCLSDHDGKTARSVDEYLMIQL